MSVYYDAGVPEIYGLVVCGGNSIRMGRDKSMLLYHHEPQCYHVYKILEHFCEDVFISCNQKQECFFDERFRVLTDQSLYAGIGPMAALLTAFTVFPGKNILFTGCDYPFLTSVDLDSFLSNSMHQNKPAAFYNQQQEIYEPLLAWYPFTAAPALKKMFLAGHHSLQLFLKKTEAIKYIPQNKNAIISVDTPEGFIQAKSRIGLI